MKTSTNPLVSKIGRISGVSALTLIAAVTATLLTAQAADVQWQGGTASYNNTANWNPATIPGITDSAINDSGSSNAVQINLGDPDWTVGQIRAGNSAGDGAFVQNGQTVTVLGTNYNGPVITEFFTPFRLGILAADTGTYTLNGGTLNYGTGQLSVGTDGTGIMNINGGSIVGSGNFAVNAGGITTPNPAVLTATAGHGPYMGDYTYFEKGYYTLDSSVGLPPAGSTVASVGDPTGHSYTLAPSYTAPNAVIVDAVVPNATITLPTPTACSGLSFMCSCGNGPVNLTYTINHSSGTAETGTLVVQDWFAGTNTINATNEVLATYARVDALGRNFQVTGPVSGMTGNPPYMWSVDVPVSNPNTVTSIDLTYVSGNGPYATATILGVSAQTGGSGPFAPLAINGYNYDVVVENGAPSPVVSPSITDVANQTNGTLSISGELWVGNNGVGIYNLTNGTINASNWVNVGRYGGTGTFNMAGGTINKSGNAFTVGANAGNAAVGAVGIMNQSGGTINSSSEVWIGQANNTPGLGTGTYNISGTAVLNVTNWLAVAREGGIGTLNISGGSIYKTGNGNVTITHGTGAAGTVNQSGGTFTVASGQVFIGEDSGAATWNMTGGTANFGVVHIDQNASASGTLNLNGGVMSLQELTTGNTGGYSTLTFDGGTLQATGDNANFLHDLTEVDLNAGGVTIDSQAYNITIPQDLPTFGSGSGGLTKAGSGTLTLTGANSYSGPTIVSGGKLAVRTDSTGGGEYLVADGAELAEEVLSANAQLNMANFTVGTSTGVTLDFDLGNFGNPTAAPINVGGTFAANGTITINIADGLPQLGEFPLIQYPPGGMTGSPAFAIGSLPTGVTASIVNNTGNNSIDLNITAANLPRWDGQAGGNWDIGLTTNWINIGTGLPVIYHDGDAVVFDDSAAGTTTVNLTTTVHPGTVTVTNSSLNYTFVGTGSIAGSIGLNKQGSGTLSVLNAGDNSYTGPTVISGGTLSVTNLADGGSPSAIGASSADPANLVLAGGSLSYSGPATTINRGYSLQSTNGSGIDAENNLSVSGLVTAAAGSSFTKTGPAQLAYSTAGNNTLSGGDYLVQAGSVVIDGSAGPQTNTVQGAFRVAGSVNAVATLTNATLNVNDNAVGNVTGSFGSMTMSSNSTLNVNSWFTLGDAANSVSFFTMNGGTLNVPNGRLFLCSAPGTMATLNINGGVVNKNSGDITCIADGGWNGSGARTGVVNQVAGTCNFNTDVQVANTALATAVYNFHGGAINSTNEWFVIGRSGGNGTFNMDGGTLTHVSGGQPAFIVGSGAGNNSLFSVGVLNQSAGTINCSSEYWIAENTGTEGTNNISGTAVLNLQNWLSIGRGGYGVINFSGGTITKAGNGNIVDGDGGVGYVNQTAGTLTSDGELWVGQGGSTSTYDLSGGTIVINNWVAIGRGAPGVFNMSGGSLTKTGNSGNHLLIGAGHDGVLNQTGGAITNLLSTTRIADGPTGTWNLSGGSAVLSVLHIAENSGNVGTLNLNGGTLSATEVTTGNTGGTSTLNLNGGTIIAGSGASANFLHDLTVANVETNGAFIDSGANTINIGQSLLGDVNGDGGLVKNGSGTLYLNGANTYTNMTMVNAGALGGSGGIQGPVTVTAGARLSPGTQSIGTLTINNTLSLDASSSTLVKVSMGGGVTNDMVTGLTSVNYGGTLVVTNAGASPLVPGTQFHLVNAGSHVGDFANSASVTILPAGKGTFDAATGMLTITASGVVTFNPVKVSGNTLILTGDGGAAAGSPYTLLTTTNLATPFTAWTTNATGNLDGSGMFSNNITINPADPVRFFDVKTGY